MFTFLSYRKYIMFVPIVCTLSLLFALYVQHVEGINPCPLCIMQRIAMMLTGLCALIALCWNKLTRSSSMWLGLSCIFAIVGLATSLRHTYMQYTPQTSMSCGPGLEYWIETLPISQVLSHIFLGVGDCGKIDWYFLGLSMPVWVSVIFLVIFIWLVALFWRKTP
jgi:disulfide bond formation protein DsbB